MDQLYLIEVLVDKIIFATSNEEKPQKNEIVISVTFGNIVNMAIEPGSLRENYVEDRDVFKADVAIDFGQSYLFPTKAKDLLGVMKQLPLSVSLIKKCNETLLGTAIVPWTPEFLEFVDTSTFQPEHVNPASTKGSFQISGVDGNILGDIELFVKLSSLGRNFQTQFQIVEPKPILDKTPPKKFIFKGANAEATFQAQRYGEVGESSDMLPVSLLYNPANPKWQPKAPIRPADMTAEKINEVLCKNRDCPGAKKFKEFGLGPAATGTGLGSLIGPTDVPISYGMSHTYGNLENYGPYGMFSRPKRLDEPFIPKDPPCSCGPDNEVSVEGSKCECGGPATMNNENSCETQTQAQSGGCCGGPLRLTGGAPGEDENKVPEPMMMCKDLMQSFDKVLSEYKKALGPCGQVVCPFAPNIIGECCKKTCQKPPGESSMQTGFVGPPANNNLMSACGVETCPYSRNVTTGTDKSVKQKQMKSACGSPSCPYTREKVGNATDEEILEVHLMDGPTNARSCGSPKCPFPLQPSLPPLEPIHWDCPDPLPKGPCRNPQCPLKPPELRYNLVARGPCGNTTCPFATPPKCPSLSCPFGPPQPCPYAQPPPPPPACEPDCGGPCCMPGCPPSPCPPPSCPPPSCPPPNCPPPSPCCCVCGNPGCPSHPPTCGDPFCPLNPKPLPCPGLICPPPPCPPGPCGGPTCPYTPCPPPCPPPSPPCGDPTCPFSGPPSPGCGNPSCPFAPPPPQSNNACDNPSCPFAQPPPQSNNACGNPACPFAQPPPQSNNACGNPSCPFAPSASISTGPCGEPSCPFAGLSPKNNSPCKNPTCPFAEKELSNDTCGSPDCPFAPKKVSPQTSSCGNPNCPCCAGSVGGGARTSIGNADETDHPTEYTSGDRDPEADLEACTPQTCMADGDGNLECALCREDTSNGKRGSKGGGKRDSKSAPAIGGKPAKGVKRNSKSDKAISKGEGKKKQKSKFVYKLGDLYPGTHIGHKTCVIPGRNVPAKMGWLWNVHTPCVGLKPRLGWRPGAVGRTIAKRIMAHRKAKGIKLLEPLGPSGKRKYKSKYSAYESDSDATVAPKPTLLVKKREGCYYITMNPLKDPKTIEDNENPYMDCTPLQFKITQKEDKEKSCFCSGEEDKSDSELDIEFTPPAGIIRPERLKRKKNVVHTDTQYNPEDFTPKKEGKGKGGKKDKGGKGKGKKGKK